MSLEGLDRDAILELEQELLAKVQEWGGKGGNISLQRELKWPEDRYWSVRDRLVDSGRLELARGKGGSVRLVSDPEPGEGEHEARATVSAPAVADPFPNEEALYEPMAEVIRSEWAKDKRLTVSLVEITARQGRRETGGTWTRPDITVVSLSTFLYVPGKHFEITTFEVKPLVGLDVTAVYEALAHSRAATRSFVLIHAPEAQLKAAEKVLTSVCEEAKRLGVGVIVATNPNDYDTWEERQEAVLNEASPERLHDFVALQLSNGAKEQLQQWFR